MRASITPYCLMPLLFRSAVILLHVCFLEVTQFGVQAARSREFASSQEINAWTGEKEKELRVLTYNVCWGCMEADEMDSTGMTGQLKKGCLKHTEFPGVTGDNGMGLKVTQCAENIGEAVYSYGKDVGGYDLMAFQEASNIGDLRLLYRAEQDKERIEGVSMKTVEFGARLAFNHTKGIHKGEFKRTWIASSYNEATMGPKSVAIPGRLEQALDRPWLILIFDERRVIFINVHNAQPGRKGQPITSWYDFLEEMNKSPLLQNAFIDNKDREKYRVILAGDFNDLGGRLPGCLTIPWNNIVMNLEKKEPSCCSSELGKRGRFPGDYIMDSESNAVNQVPKRHLSDFKKEAQSDHWPVEALLVSTGPKHSRKEGTCEFKHHQKEKSSNTRSSGPKKDSSKTRPSKDGRSEGRDNHSKSPSRETTSPKEHKKKRGSRDSISSKKSFGSEGRSHKKSSKVTRPSRKDKESSDAQESSEARRRSRKESSDKSRKS